MGSLSKSKIPHIKCEGTPYEIGYAHGKGAQPQIKQSISFYQSYFLSKSSLSWDLAIEAARGFLPLLEQSRPDYLEEMRGVAEGASIEGEKMVTFDDVLAINCRTEISMGLMNDGCTALTYRSPASTIIAQNWDWNPQQQTSLVALHISQHGKPSIAMVTEGGIIGKIGLNSRGVGVCLNAIRARGVDYTRLPVHLALRAVLDSPTAQEAVAQLDECGVAAACHILVADDELRVGLECTSGDVVRINEEHGIIAHTNHFCFEHKGDVKEPVQLKDSKPRLLRITELLSEASGKGGVDVEGVERLLEDQQGLPCAINRVADGKESVIATLFSIVMDLTSRVAHVRIGRPTDGGEDFELNFDSI